MKLGKDGVLAWELVIFLCLFYLVPCLTFTLYFLSLSLPPLSVYSLASSQEYMNITRDMEQSRSSGGSDTMLSKLRERLEQKEKALEVCFLSMSFSNKIFHSLTHTFSRVLDPSHLTKNVASIYSLHYQPVVLLLHSKHWMISMRR